VRLGALSAISAFYASRTFIIAFIIAAGVKRKRVSFLVDRATDVRNCPISIFRSRLIESRPVFDNVLEFEDSRGGREDPLIVVD